MILILEIVMLIMGLVALIRGRIQLAGSRSVEGPAARIAGMILMLPLPLAFAVGFYLGAQAVATGKNVTSGQFQLTLVLIELGLLVGCFIVALLVCLVGSSTDDGRRVYRRFDDRYDD